jgi:hypothetical protein
MNNFVVYFCISFLVAMWMNATAIKSSARKDAQFRDDLIGMVQDISDESARALDQKLQDLQSNEIHTERLIHTETIKPVFTNVCATDDYVRLFNESTDRDERTLSGQPDGQVPGKVAAPGRDNRQ